jgi:hypothetical protein
MYFVLLELQAGLQDVLEHRNITPFISWNDAREQYAQLFDRVSNLLITGLTTDQLESVDQDDAHFIKYHHRTGLNSFLSENYVCKIFYDGHEWASVQHAYQERKCQPLSAQSGECNVTFFVAGRQVQSG